LEGGAALGVGDHDGVPMAGDLEHHRVDPDGRWREGGLDQQPGATAEGQPGELGAVQLYGPDEGDLRPGENLDIDSPSSELLSELFDQPADGGGLTVIAVIDVGCCHDRADAGPMGRAYEGERAPDVLGPVVDARKHVAVQVDHARGTLCEEAPIAALPFAVC
jgi:hypothetical protein